MKTGVGIKWLIVGSLILTLSCIILFWKYEGLYFRRKFDSKNKRKVNSIIPLRLAPVFTVGDNSDYITTRKTTKKSLTVVTAYIDIGEYHEPIQNRFSKRDYNQPMKGVLTNHGYNQPMKNSKRKLSLEDYKAMSEPYRYLLNPLIFYTDSPEFAKFIIYLRNQTGLFTTIVLIDKQSLWPFKLEPKINALYQNPQYSGMYSNIISSNYTSVSLSKLPILVDAIKRKPYRTTYYCWMDLGFLGYLKGQNKYFHLEVPKTFNKTKIGVTRVFQSDLKHVDIKNIVSKDLVWISGSMYLGLPLTIMSLERQFHSAVMRYLNRGVIGTDAQIIHGMYSMKERRRFPVDVYLQYFTPKTRRIRHPRKWDYLGYLMYKVDNKKINKIYFD